MNTKKITKNGAVTIPKEYRVKYGFNGGLAVDISEIDGNLILSSHTDTCIICGSISDVTKFKGVCMCISCAEVFVNGKE